MFKLDDGMDKALTSPDLKTMETYVKELNVKNQNNKASVIGIFTTHYGDDAVAKALVTAQRKAKMVDDAKRIRQLRNAQLLTWLNSEKSVDDVFKLLKLREHGYIALASRKMEVLDDYMKLVIRTNSGEETLLQTLTMGFGGERKLARQLVLAKKDPRTRELATALQNALLNKWLASSMQPASVLKKLKLDSGMDDVLSYLNRHTLARFISMYNARNPDSKTSLVGALSAQYGDDIVAKRLMTGSTKENTEAAAKQLRSEQLEEWLNSQKSIDDVFQLLKLRDDGYLVLTSRKLEVLEDYIALFNREKGIHETVLKTLTTGFGGESGFKQILRVAKFNRFTRERTTLLEWLANKLQPNSVLKELRLDRGMKYAISDENLNSLAAFISMYNAANPNSKASLIGTLSAHYGDDVVAQALVHARTYPAVKPLAINLQQQQFQEWQKSKKSALDIFKLLKIQSQDFVALPSPKLETVSEYIKALKATDPGNTSDLLTVVIIGLGGDSALARAVASELKKLNARDPLAAALSTAAEYELMLFKRWRKGDINPNSINSQFRVHDDAFVGRYRAYYDEKKALVNPPVITAINPRRF
ncbi:hypothetical protein PI124_g15700 [Phytophthora idaei]|nr:hypothetical protein PI125_g15804 [Phytophthora idaei]KAG3239367.1 hypothetical protein PI124_g15700 [Phytophthora idaei]